MKCSNCDGNTPKGSKYCQHCGKEIALNINDTANTTVSSNDIDTSLWEKFIEVNDSRGEEREKYIALMSDDAWELINRLGNNTFERFISDNKEDLNKLPYRLIEKLKDIFDWTVRAGYWVWFAESEYNTINIKPLQNFTFDELKEKWEELTIKNPQKTYSTLSDDLANTLSMYLQYRVEKFLEEKEVKELTNATVEKFREILAVIILWGYYIALSESHFRKK